MSGLLGGLGGDAGLLAAGAAAVFLLYTAATMAAAAKRKKRAATPTSERYHPYITSKCLLTFSINKLKGTYFNPKPASL